MVERFLLLTGVAFAADNQCYPNETHVKAGDITIARAGQAHALRNDSDEPLHFIDVIAQNDGAKTQK